MGPRKPCDLRVNSSSRQLLMNLQKVLPPKQQKQPMIDWFKKATSKNISGSYNFHVKVQPHEEVDSSSTIIVTPFTDRSQQNIVPCHYRWFRIRNGIKEQSQKYRGNSYVCDSSDIGAVITADINSNDAELPGKAKVQLGPVKIAAEVKKSILDTLANGSTLMKGYVCLGECEEKECDFRIFSDMIKIRHCQSVLNYSFNYSSYEPRIESNPKDTSKISIFFSQGQEISPHTFMQNMFGARYSNFTNTNNYECRMQIRFVNRQAKDLFLLTLKAFFTKKQLSNFVVIQKLQEVNFNQKEKFDFLVEIETLNSDITRLYHANEEKEKEKIRLTQELTRMQREMEEIVTTYARIADQKVRSIKDLNDSYALLLNKKEDVFGRKCEHLERQNMNLNDRIKLLSSEIDEIRFNTSSVKRNQTIFNNANTTQITAIQVQRQNSSTFENILENLNESRISVPREDDHRLVREIERLTEEKTQLERKLEKSFHIIEDLEKKLKSTVNTQQSMTSSYHKNQADIQSYSMAMDMEKLQNDNNRMLMEKNHLMQWIDNLKAQNNILRQEIGARQSNSKVQISQSLSGDFSEGNSSNSQRELRNMQKENEGLKRELQALKITLKNEETKSERYLKDKIILQRKAEELENEVSMLRRNQEVLNRSQHLSMEMESYNDEKIKNLQENNNFLITENEKLSKLIEKYMLQARENIQLRRQILQLKEKINQNATNPQRLSNSAMSGLPPHRDYMIDSNIMIGVNKL